MTAFETFTSVGYAIIEPIFELFTNPGVPIAISLAFLVALVLASLIFIWVTERPRRQIKHAIAILGRLGDQGEFTATLHDVQEIMRRLPVLRHAWQEFEETLIKPAPDESQIVRNTSRPGEYFNHEASGLTFPIFHALPNYFVGLGLLFTFLGIVAALYFASSGVTGPIDEAQRALGKLLNAATFKFLTSIAGLFCSIVFSLLYRWRIRAIDRIFGQLCDQLERLMSFVAPEQLAAKQLRQLEQQTSEVKRFNTNIAMEIADAMASKLEASVADGLRRAIEPLTRAVERLSEGMTDDNRGALREMVEAFQQQLRQGAGRELAALGQALAQMQGVLSSATEKFGNQSELFGTKIAEAATRLERAVEVAAGGLGRGAEDAARRFDEQVAASSSTLGGALDRAGDEFASKLDGVVTEIARSLGPLGERLAGFQASLEGLDERLRAQAAAFGEVAARTKINIEMLDATAARLRDAGAPVADSARALKDTAEAAGRALEGLRAIQGQVGDAAGQMAATAATLERSWGAYEQRFDQVDQSLERTFERFAEGTQAHHSNVQDFVRDLGTALDSAVTTLASSVEQLESTLAEISESADRLRDALTRQPALT